MEVNFMTFEGRWDINKIENWNDDELLLGAPPYIYVDTDNTGYFQFGSINGDMYLKANKNHESKIMEFNFSSTCGFDEISGKGWMRIINDGLEGVLKFEDNDSVEFYASRGNCNL
jgi:hypothetical protein